MAYPSPLVTGGSGLAGASYSNQLRLLTLRGLEALIKELKMAPPSHTADASGATFGACLQVKPHASLQHDQSNGHFPRGCIVSTSQFSTPSLLPTQRFAHPTGLTASCVRVQCRNHLMKATDLPSMQVPRATLLWCNCGVVWFLCGCVMWLWCGFGVTLLRLWCGCGCWVVVAVV